MSTDPSAEHGHKVRCQCHEHGEDGQEENVRLAEEGDCGRLKIELSKKETRTCISSTTSSLIVNVSATSICFVLVSVAGLVVLRLTACCVSQIIEYLPTNHTVTNKPTKSLPSDRDAMGACLCKTKNDSS